MAGVFQFKQFSVDQTGCAMKINTDGVLLGSLTEIDSPKSILDIGTGTGVIALMLAQRAPCAMVDAVEIDHTAAQTASANFANSKFANRLRVYPGSFAQYFALHPDKKYDMIVSNPPFYINSLRSPGAGKMLAKHADEGFFKQLISSAANHLHEDGIFWLILPIDTAALVKQLAAENNLYLKRSISIMSYPRDDPHREILGFGFDHLDTIHFDFLIYESVKQYSGQYQTALRDFFTIFP